MCTCKPGFSGDGRACTETNNCVVNPCLNGGSCTNGVNSFTCTCAPGYSGTTCATNINDCAGSPCLNGGVCTDGVNSFTCACVAGYTGATCSVTATTCAAIKTTTPGAPDGVYTIDPDGPGGVAAFAVYCDMTRDGGGWTLIEIGKALGTSLRTHLAVGTLSSPAQATSAKFARTTASAILAAGSQRLRFGEADYGYLYVGTMQQTWIDTGYGTPGYGTVVSPQLISTQVGGATYGGSRFAWPLDGMPAACLNSDGTSNECGLGVHIGTWAGDIGDNAYVNYSPLCCNLIATDGYEVWAR